MDKPHLLVEGADDCHFMHHLTRAMGLADCFAVKQAGGVANLRLELETLLMARGARVGVIADADTEPAQRWQSLVDQVALHGFEVPRQPVGGGYIGATAGATIGLWLMPDNQRVGMLEHLIEAMIPAHDDLLPLAHQAVDAIPPEQRRFGEKHQKAIVHTWLAWQEEPGTPLGQAVSKHYLDAAHPALGGFTTWLHALAGA